MAMAMAMGTRRVTCSKQQEMMKMSFSKGCDDKGPLSGHSCSTGCTSNNSLVQGKLKQLCLCQYQKHVPLLVMKEDSAQHSRRLL